MIEFRGFVSVEAARFFFMNQISHPVLYLLRCLKTYHCLGGSATRNKVYNLFVNAYHSWF